MATSIPGVLPSEFRELIMESKVLLVGAGGIGCEVLKNLVLTGFCKLEVIDLNNIQESDLNSRQFLFDEDFVGKPKSDVIRSSVLQFNPDVEITWYVGDITDPIYDEEFFNSFTLVINALDNEKVRSHVNSMCLSCQIPLIESGTMVYNGQMKFIKKGVSMCCKFNPRFKPCPTCTIGNTPEEDIHCIEWAKCLFNQLFGESDKDVLMDKEKLSDWAILNDYNPIKLLKKVFFDDNTYLLNMEHLSADKNLKPVLLDESLLDQEHFEYSHILNSEILTLEQSISMFRDCIIPIKEKWEKSQNKYLTWDKEDDDMINFVVSSSNLWSAIFNVPFKTHFDIKSMAANVIPAIATVNALIGGQIVIHALKIIRDKYKEVLKMMPNPNMYSYKGEVIILKTDINSLTVRQLEDLVLKKELKILAPDVMMLDRIIISCDVEDNVNMYDKTLSEVGMTNGSSFMVDDDFNNYSVKIKVYNKEKSVEEDPDYELLSDMNEYHTDDELEIEMEPYIKCEDTESEDTESEDTESEDTEGEVNHVMVGEEEIHNEEKGAEEIHNEEKGAVEIGYEEKGAEEIHNEEKDSVEIGCEEICYEEKGAEEIHNEEKDSVEIGYEKICDEEKGAEKIHNEEKDSVEIGCEEICNEEKGAEEIHNEEKGAVEIDNGEICNEEVGIGIKRTANEAIDVHDAKKSRV